MVKTRLTTPHRRAIRDRLLAKWMAGPEEAQLHADYKQLAQNAYDQLYSSEIQAQMRAMPKGWLSERETIMLQFGRGSEGYTELHFSGQMPYNSSCTCRSNRPEPVAKFFLDMDRKKTHQIADKSQLTKEFYRLRALREARAKQYEKLSSDTMVALHAYPNVEALQAEWPECKPFCWAPQEVGAKQVYQLPAIRLEDLNKSLGLTRQTMEQFVEAHLP